MMGVHRTGRRRGVVLCIIPSRTLWSSAINDLG